MNWLKCSLDSTTNLLTLKHSLEQRLSIYEKKHLYKMASTLEPRFKLAWCMETEILEQRAILTNEAESLTTAAEPAATSPSEATSISPPKEHSKLFNIMTTRRPVPQTEKRQVLKKSQDI